MLGFNHAFWVFFEHSNSCPFYSHYFLCSSGFQPDCNMCELTWARLHNGTPWVIISHHLPSGISPKCHTATMHQSGHCNSQATVTGLRTGKEKCSLLGEKKKRKTELQMSIWICHSEHKTSPVDGHVMFFPTEVYQKNIFSSCKQKSTNDFSLNNST